MSVGALLARAAFGVGIAVGVLGALAVIGYLQRHCDEHPHRQENL
jgi:hypothetical protein